MSSAPTANGRPHVDKIIKAITHPALDRGEGPSSCISRIEIIAIKLLISVHHLAVLWFLSLGCEKKMPHHMELRSVTRRCGGLSLDVDAPNEGKKKRKRNDLDREEALFISKDIQSGERVLYLQEVPKIKASHCRAWSCILERRTHEPIIRSYYRFALKGRPNTYGVGMNLRAREKKDLWY